MTEHPVISLGDLNFNYIRDETFSINPISYIETAYDMHQLIDQPTRVDDKTSLVLAVILTSHPALHRKRAVLQYTLSDHYLIYTHMEFENTKQSVVDHNTVKFRDMKNFDMESFYNDLISCDILHGSQDNDDISFERWKFTYTVICDKHAPMKSLWLKKTDQIHGWPMILQSLCMSATMYMPRLYKAMIQNYGRIIVIYGIK